MITSINAELIGIDDHVTDFCLDSVSSSTDDKLRFVVRGEKRTFSDLRVGLAAFVAATRQELYPPQFADGFERGAQAFLGQPIVAGPLPAAVATTRSRRCWSTRRTTRRV